MMDKVLIMVSTYNGGKYLPDQLDSLYGQKGVECHLLVRDDGSKDNTLNILQDYKKRHGNMTILQGGNLGVGGSFRALINDAVKNHSEFDYFAFCDQDDVWLENKVSECVKYLESVDFIVHKKNCFDSDSRKIVKTDDDIQLPDTWLHNIFHMKLFGCCMAFNRKLLNIAIPFPHRLIGHDYWISSLAIRFLSCDVINEPLINYRLHSDAVSQGKHKSIIYKISYRLQLYKQILQRIKKQKQRKII